MSIYQDLSYNTEESLVIDEPENKLLDAVQENKIFDDVQIRDDFDSDDLESVRLTDKKEEMSQMLSQVK